MSGKNMPGWMVAGKNEAGAVADAQIKPEPVSNAIVTPEPIVVVAQEPLPSSSAKEAKPMRRRSATQSQAAKPPKVAPVSVAQTPAVISDPVVASDPNPSPDPVKAAPLTPDAQIGIPDPNEIDVDGVSPEVTSLLETIPNGATFTLTSPGGNPTQYYREDNVFYLASTKKNPNGSRDVQTKKVLNRLATWALKVDAAVAPNIAPTGPASADPNVPLSPDAERKAKERAILGASTPEEFRDAVAALDKELDNGLNAKQWAQSMFLAFSTNTANKDAIRTYAQGLPEDYFIRAKWEALATAQFEAKNKPVEAVEPKEGKSDVSELSKEKIEKLEGELNDLRMAYAKKDYEETGVWKRLSGIFGKSFKDEKALEEKMRYREKLQELLAARLELLKKSGKEGDELKKAMADELQYFGAESKIKLYDAWTNAQMEKKGFSEKILDLGRQYNKLPLWKKVAIGATVLGVAGAAAGGLLGTAGGAMAASLIGLRRGVAAGGLFATFEAGLEKLSQGSSKKDVVSESILQSEIIAQHQSPEERMAIFQGFLEGKISGSDSELEGRVKGRDRRRVTALGGALVATFGLEEVWHYLNGAENAVPQNAQGVVKGIVTPPAENLVAANGGMAVSPVTSAPTVGADTQPSPGHFDAPSEGYKEALKLQADAKILREMPAVYEIVKGDTTWRLLDGYLTDHDITFAGMSEGQRTHAIDVLKEKLKDFSPKELRDAGFSSGNIDKLRVGDEINLDKLLGAVDADKAIGNADTISADAVKNIEANNAKIADWAKAHPGEAINDAVIDEKILGKGGVSGAGIHVRGGMPELLNSFDDASADRLLNRPSVPLSEIAPSPSEVPFNFKDLNSVEMRRGSDWFMQIFRVEDQVGGKDWVFDKDGIKGIMGTKMSDILKVEANGAVSVKENVNFSLAQSKNLQEFVSELPKVFPGGRAALSDFLRARPNISVGEYIARVAKAVPQGTRIGLYTTTN